MTDLTICDLSPDGLRGYALGLRETAALLTRTAIHSHEPVFLLAVATCEAWEREAAIIERFADRLEDLEEGRVVAAPAAEQPTPVTPERVAAWAARFERAARFTPPSPEPEPEPDDTGEEWRGLGESLFPPPPEAAPSPWYSQPNSAATYTTLADALNEDAWRDQAIVPLVSSEWDGTRWVFRDDEGRITMAETREEATAYIAELLTQEETAQTGLADAVAEGVASEALTREVILAAAQEAKASFLADHPELGMAPSPAELQPRPQRSDSPWTPERLALLHRVFPTTMTLEAIRHVLNALPGLTIPSPEAVRVKAQKLEIHRRGEPIPEEFAEAAATRTRTIGGLAQNGGKPGTWTAERLRILHRDYPGTRPLADVLEEINSLPGPHVPTTGAVAAKAKTLGLQRRVPVAVGEPIAPPLTTPIPPMTTEDQAEALERLRKGIDKGARDVMEYFGCSHDEAMQVVERHRARTGKAA